MASFEQNGRLGVVETIIGVGLTLAKTGYGIWRDEQIRQQNETIANSGVAAMNQRIIDQSVAKALEGQEAESAKSKTTTYIAIGAAALISFIALTK